MIQTQIIQKQFFKKIGEIHFSSASSIEFAGLQPGKIYKLFIRAVQQSADGFHYLRFNNNNNSIYQYSAYDEEDNGSFMGYGSGGGGAQTTEIKITNPSRLVYTGGNLFMEFTIRSFNNRILIYWQGGYYGANSTNCHIAGYGRGEDNLSSIQYILSAGNFSGLASLYQIISEIDG